MNRLSGLCSGVNTATAVLTPVSVCVKLRRLSRYLPDQTRPGKVLGVFSQAVYIGQGRAILCLAGPEAGNLPYGALLPLKDLNALGGLQVDDPALLGDGGLFFPRSGLSLDLTGGPAWRGGGPGPASEALRRANPDVLQEVLRQSDAAAAGTPSRIEQTYRDTMHELSQALASSWRAGRAEAATEAARSLLGLGPGLTPAGDDFLLGLLAVLHAWRRAYPPAPAFASAFEEAKNRENDAAQTARLLSALRQGLRAAIWERTGPIAAFMLYQGLGGCFPQRVTEAVAALTAATPPDARAAYERLLRMGASSGRDVLEGIFFGAGLLEG